MEAPRLIDFHEVQKITTASRSLIYDLIARDQFPVPVKLGKKSVWPAHEVHAWLSARIENRRWPLTAGRPAKRAK